MGRVHVGRATGGLLFVARVDGTRLRRLTDDAFRDRGPSGGHLMGRLAFYSDRSGTTISGRYTRMAVRSFDCKAQASRAFQSGRLTERKSLPSGSRPGTSSAFGPSGKPLPLPQPASVRRAVSAHLVVDQRQSAGRAHHRRFEGGYGLRRCGQAVLSRVPGDLAHSNTWTITDSSTDGRHLIVRRSDGIALIDALKHGPAACTDSGRRQHHPGLKRRRLARQQVDHLLQGRNRG